MALVVTGLLNKQIAHELGTVEKTVKVHRARVMVKMRAAFRATGTLCGKARDPAVRVQLLGSSLLGRKSLPPS